MRAEATKRTSVHPVDITGTVKRREASGAAMQKIAEQFTRASRRSLPFLVRRRCRLVAGRIGPAQLALDEPADGATCQIMLETTGKPGWAAIRLDGGAIRLVVEGSLGGAAPEEGEEPEPVPVTDLSLAQRALVSRVARALGTDFADAAREGSGVELEVVRAECLRPGETPVLPKDGVAAECLFEGLQGPARIWLFASPEILELATRERAGGEVAAGDPRMAAALETVPLDVVAELGRVSLGLRRLLALRPGDVLRLPTATDDSIQVRVGGVVKLSGVPVLSRGQLSVQITGRHEE